MSNVGESTLKRLPAIWLVALAALFLMGVAVFGAVGLTEWTENGVAVCDEQGTQKAARLMSDGGGGAIAVWQDYRRNSYDIYAQRLLADGSTASGWKVGGVPVCTAAGHQHAPRLAPDGEGGAFIAWWDTRGLSYDVYAQRLLSNGSIAPGWPAKGVALCTAPGHQFKPQLTGDGAGGAIIAWYDYRRGGTADIYAQRMAGRGTPTWATDGITVCAASGGQYDPQVVGDGAAGAIIAWEDARSNVYNIYAQRVLSDGRTAWLTDGIPIGLTTSVQYDPRLVSDGEGGAIVAWEDYRGGGTADIYARRVLSDGNTAPGWPVDGLAVCSAPHAQWDPQLVSDGMGGAIIVWEDYRSALPDTRIYAQRVLSDSSIAPGWPAGGLPICPAPGGQYTPRLVEDGAGGAIVAWKDARRDDSDILAQRVLADGALAWMRPAPSPTNTYGITICAATGDQDDPQLAASFQGESAAIIAWHDARTIDPDIYAQRIMSLDHWALMPLLMHNAPFTTTAPIPQHAR